MVENDQDRRRGRRTDIDVGRYLLFGAMAGTLVFAITQNAVWIGVGACVGILVAGIMSMAR